MQELHARMPNPAVIVPGAMAALMALATAATKAAEEDGLAANTLDLVYLRASQINGCSVCLLMHANDLKKNDESDDRLFTVAGWRDAPFFTPAERAALALTEAVTRLSDRPDAVTDDVWEEAARHYDEQALAGLLLAIASINVWNRLNVATAQVAGEWKA